MDITSIKIYGQVPVEKKCQCEAGNVVAMLFPLCDVEPCIASWTRWRHVSWKISNLLIRIAKGGRIKLA